MEKVSEFIPRWIQSSEFIPMDVSGDRATIITDVDVIES
jgi:hypothetical protein